MNCKDIIYSNISYREFKEYRDLCISENKITKDYVIESIARYILLVMWAVLYIVFMNLLKSKMGITAFNIIVYIACSIAYVRLIHSLCQILFPLHKGMKSRRHTLRLFRTLSVDNILQIQDLLRGQEKIEVEHINEKHVVLKYLDSKNRKLVIDNCPMFIKTSMKNEKIDFSWIDRLVNGE